MRTDIEGPVHYLDFGGEGPPLVCVHGLAGSALNWMAVGPEVAGTPAILVGNSMGGLLAVRQAARHPETVAGLVLVDPALPWRGRRPRDLQVFALFAALLTPGLGDGLLSGRARRWGAERVVATAFALCCADPDRVPHDVVRAHVDLEAERLTSRSGERALAQAARSLVWALRRRGY